MNTVAKYFSKLFCKINKLNLSDITILDYLYELIFSNSLQRLIIDNEVYFQICERMIVSEFEGLITQANISQKFKKFKSIGIIKNIVKIKGKLYISFDFNAISRSLVSGDVYEHKIN